MRFKLLAQIKWFFLAMIINVILIGSLQAQPNNLGTISFQYMNPSEVKDFPVQNSNSGNPALSQNTFAFSFTLPVVLEQKKRFLMFTPSYKHSNFALENARTNSSGETQPTQNLKYASVRINYIHVFNKKWVMTAGFAPALGTNDFGLSNFNDYKFMAFIQFIRPLGEGKRLGLGLSFTDNLGFFLPLPLISYTINKPRYSLNIIVPALIEYRRKPAEDFHYGVRGNIDGGNYALKLDNSVETDIRVQYSQLRAGLFVSHRIHKAFWFDLDAGMSGAYRSYKIVDDDGDEITDFSIKPGLFVRSGITMRLPRN